MAFIEASRVTSASKAAAAPPPLASFDAIATVSSADFTSLSTHRTLAPSCTKRMTVARPLPMPVPGPWPAPTTIAILSLRRIVPFLLFLRRPIGASFLRPFGARTVIHNASRSGRPLVSWLGWSNRRVPAMFLARLVREGPAGTDDDGARKAAGKREVAIGRLGA